MAESNGLSLSHSDECSYSVPREAQVLFQNAILENPSISKYLPEGLKSRAKKVRFVGKTKPTLPVNWRLAESASALHALEASLLSLLLEEKYQVPAPQAEINP
jgi:hypothetical protein